MESRTILWEESIENYFWQSVIENGHPSNNYISTWHTCVWNFLINLKIGTRHADVSSRIYVTLPALLLDCKASLGDKASLPEYVIEIWNFPFIYLSLPVFLSRSEREREIMKKASLSNRKPEKVIEQPPFPSVGGWEKTRQITPGLIWQCAINFGLHTDSYHFIHLLLRIPCFQPHSHRIPSFRDFNLQPRRYAWTTCTRRVTGRSRAIQLDTRDIHISALERLHLCFFVFYTCFLHNILFNYV